MAAIVVRDILLTWLVPAEDEAVSCKEERNPDVASLPCTVKQKYIASPLVPSAFQAALVSTGQLPFRRSPATRQAPQCPAWKRKPASAPGSARSEHGIGIATVADRDSLNNRPTIRPRTAGGMSDQRRLINHGVSDPRRARRRLGLQGARFRCRWTIPPTYTVASEALVAHHPRRRVQQTQVGKALDAATRFAGEFGHEAGKGAVDGGRDLAASPLV